LSIERRPSDTNNQIAGGKTNNQIRSGDTNNQIAGGNTTNRFPAGDTNRVAAATPIDSRRGFHQSVEYMGLASESQTLSLQPGDTES
jgi:hypothetical protein